jgi:glycosyltransferase involved in cell wall biosynthesis
VRIGVYDRFWPTAGGGEKFAGGIAQALSVDHDVELVGHDDIDLGALGMRLQLDLSRLRLRTVAQSPSAVEAASSSYDLFVNASYGSIDRCAAGRGLYVVHFPVMPPFRPSTARRIAISAAARAARFTPGPSTSVVWRRGFYAPERVGPATYRWTDGDGELELRGVRPGDEVAVVVGRLLAPGAPPAEVELVLDGEVADRVTLRPRPPWGRPLRVLRLTAPAGTSDRLSIGVRGATHVPDHAGDRRVLGVPVLAVAAGGRAKRLVEAVHQWLAVPDIDLGFLAGYDVVANSAFSAEWVRRLWGRDAAVLHPPVTPQPRGTKEPIILHVGRFFPPGAGHSKRQADLVGAFAELGHRFADAAGWELHLVGGCDADGVAYLEQVRSAAVGLPVHIHADAPAHELRDLYGRASIYWHATGLGEDIDAHPDRFEHFGISTVEAMSAGAVPVVIAAAGQLEVVEDGVEGHHFTDLDELVARTAELIADPERLARMSGAAERRAARYGWEPFSAAVKAVVEG